MTKNIGLTVLCNCFTYKYKDFKHSFKSAKELLSDGS